MLGSMESKITEKPSYIGRKTTISHASSKLRTDKLEGNYNSKNNNVNLCVCVCVFFPSILDIKFVGRTSRGHTGGRSHRIFNPPSFCGACLDFCREKESAIPFPRRP